MKCNERWVHEETINLSEETFQHVIQEQLRKVVLFGWHTEYINEWLNRRKKKFRKLDIGNISTSWRLILAILKINHCQRNHQNTST